MPPLKIVPALITLVLCLAVSACGAFGGGSRNKVELIDRDGIDLIAAPAGHLPIIMKAGTSKERTCAGRLPDAIMDSSFGLSLPTKGMGVGTNNTDLALGGRSPQVLIVRELFFRLCEMSLNADLGTADMITLYKEALPIVDIALKSNVAGTSGVAISGQNPNANATPSTQTPVTTSVSSEATTSNSTTPSDASTNSSTGSSTDSSSSPSPSSPTPSPTPSIPSTPSTPTVPTAPSGNPSAH